MARSFYSAMMQAARAAERANRQAIQAEKRRVREELAMRREEARYAKTLDREEKAAYLESRAREVESLNAELSSKMDELRDVLFLAPEWSTPLRFAKLKKSITEDAFDPQAAIGEAPVPPKRHHFTTLLPKPGFLAGLLGGNKKYEAALRTSRVADDKRYGQAVAEFEEQYRIWEEAVERARNAHAFRLERQRAEIAEHNASIDTFEAAYRGGETDAVLNYFALILERSILPEGFPEEHRLAYVAESKQVVLEHDLPTIDVVPHVLEYTFVKSKDEIRERARPKKDIRDAYQHVIAATCLRLINEIFCSDAAAVVDCVVLNGIVESTSPATGETVRPCVVSVRVTRDDFLGLNLERVDPIACLRSLGVMSKKPEELAPVRPVMEFNTVDPRFVDESDVMSALDTRPNVMELTPSEFEGLVANLFSGMGLDTRQTRSSRDGGVDAVAFDPRPVLGGKVVIQAKRYRHTVGVSAVRDLYGTMMNEGANKGILVTTAGYGPDAFKFAQDKPIELLDGPGLLHLLAEQGIAAKIIMPPPES